mgnify:CR=1 FL=1
MFFWLMVRCVSSSLSPNEGRTNQPCHSYANSRANHLFQTVYYDPFYPALFLPSSGTPSSLLPETLELFSPPSSAAAMGFVGAAKEWTGAAVRRAAGWGVGELGVWKAGVEVLGKVPS